MNVDAALCSIVELIVRCVDPDEVLLFGSVAKETAGPHSDIDVLVIGAFRGARHRRGRELRGLLDRYPLRFDLHLLTRAEVETDARRPHSWMFTLPGHGRVLYARRPIHSSRDAERAAPHADVARTDCHRPETAQ